MREALRTPATLIIAGSPLPGREERSPSLCSRSTQLPPSTLHSKEAQTRSPSYLVRGASKKSRTIPRQRLRLKAQLQSEPAENDHQRLP